MKGGGWVIVLGFGTIIMGGGFYWLAAMTFAFGGGWAAFFSPDLWLCALPVLILAASFVVVAYRTYCTSRTETR